MYASHLPHRAAEPPIWLPFLAGLPITLCMIVMALPELGRGHSAAYRALYLAAYVVWTVPLSLFQRHLWRRRVAWWKAALILLLVTYVLSLINNAIALSMAVAWKQVPSYQPAFIFRGLDGCWLALISFCAIHAVVAYYTALQASQARVESALSHARDAELRALRYQLQPHFLFNTLNAISTLVASGQNRDANRMIARLADFLRATLHGGETHEVALADELALMEAYLDVEKARLGHRLVVRTQVGPDVLGARVPYLLLQPLVENAIRHGIAQRALPGRLELAVLRQSGRLHLEVANDGGHAEPIAAPGRSTAIGLGNVRKRLENLYPGDHSIRAGHRPDGGYLVQIDLPYQELSA